MDGTKTNYDEPKLVPRWYFQHVFHLKHNNTASILIAIETHERKDMESSQKGKIHQFHVAYITHSMQNRHGIHREHIIRILESELKPIQVKFTKNKLTKKNLSVFKC